MKAYYNEIDPYAAQWLRNLIEAGHIAPGDVDERSIEDVTPKDLHGYTQCHFFAGIGVWSHALRKSGWADDRPVWTGSCPCQPFSAAGKGGGFDDERHLWPAFFHLIEQCKPPIVLGEQVASKATGPWFDLVQADMEAMGYAFGCTPFPSAGVGAPHIRDRAYWMADAGYDECGGRDAVRDADGEHDGTPGSGEGGGPERIGAFDDPSVRSTGDGMADTKCERVCTCGQGCTSGAPRTLQGIDGQWEWVRADACAGDDGVGTRPGPTNGFWRAADWLGCRDGKWRCVEPGTQPLADGATLIVGRMQPRMEAMGYSTEDIARVLGRRNSTLAAAARNRVGRLKGYGNAINAQQAQAFIEAVMNNG